MKKIIFNASMPRSGSELLQVILHQNPKIYASSTSPLLEYQFAARTNFNLPEVASQDKALMKKAFVSMCSGMAQSYYGAVTDRPIVCDKNRGWSHFYEWVNEWNAEPKIICVVRDLRDIVASMEKIYRNNRHAPIGPDEPSKLNGMTVSQRAEYWLNSAPIGLALMRTADLIQRNLSQKILFIKYEDLCANPQKEMSDIYKFIGEDYFEHDFKNLKKEIIENDIVFGPYGSHEVSKELSPNKSKWLDILPKELGSHIRRQHAWYFDTFNY